MSRIGTTSQSAQNMAALYKDMRSKQARNYLIPHLKHLPSRKSRGGEIRKHDLQRLACHWKLNKIPGFWTENQTEEQLLSSLYKYAKKLEEASRPARPKKEVRKVSVVVQEPEEEIDWRESMKGVGSTLPPYKGDLFGTRGDYNKGLIYASRRPAATNTDISRFREKVAHSSADSSTLDKDSRADDSKSSGKSAQSSALEQLKINSTAMLHQLSKQPNHKKDLASAEAVEAVFRMWRNSPNEEVRRNCAMTLANLYTTSSMNRDDVLAPILQLGKESGDPAVLATVAKALLTRVLVDRPLSLGYVPEIISAVRTMKSRSLATTKRNIAHVLRLLLERGRRRSAVAASPSASTDETKEGGEAKEDSQGLRVLELAANEGILSLLANLATDPDDSERQEHCSAAMLTLTKLTALHNDMSGRSVLPVVVSLLQSPSPQTCDNAALVMYELVCSPDQTVSSRLVNNEDVTAALLSVAIPQAGVLTDPEHSDEDRTTEQVQHLGERATAAILRLSTEPLLLSSMVAAGVADALFSWFNFGNDRIKHNCVMALCNLFACVEGQAALVELGFVRVIIAAANIKPQPAAQQAKGDADTFEDEDENYQDPDVDVGVRKRASRALCMLSSGGEELAEHLIEENAVRALVQLTETLDAEVRLNCVQALMQLSKWPVSHPAMIQHGTIAAFTNFSTSKDPEVLEACTLGLCNLANSEDSHHALLENDVISTLVRLAGATGLRQQCVSAFCQLSAFRPAHEAIINQGVLPMLIAQSRFTNAHIRRECAQALYNLSCMVGSEAQEVAHGVPAALTIVALFRADDGLTKDLCAAALFNLMYDPAGRQQLLDDGVLWAFIKLALAAGTSTLTPSGEPIKADTAETCTRLIRNLSCDEEMVRHTIEKRTLAALSKFAPSPNPTTRQNCGITLCEITRRTHLHDAAIDRGILSVVAKLANVRGDLDVAECCASVLFRLTTRPESRDKLSSDETVPIILIALLRTAVGETVSLAGRASRGPARGEDQAAFEAPVTTGKKRVLALKRALTAILCNLSGNREDCAALASNGAITFMNLVCHSGGPVGAVPPNAVPSDDAVDCPLRDAVSIDAIVRTLYNITGEQECCAMLAGTALDTTAATASHLLATVASDADGRVYDVETARMAAVCVVNLSAQDRLVSKLYCAREIDSLVAVANAWAEVQVREACAKGLTNIIVGGLYGADDEDAAQDPSTFVALMKLWEESSHGETQSHATCDAYCFLFWFLSRRTATLHALLDHGLLPAVLHVVSALGRRADKTVTDRKRDALMLEVALIIQAVTDDADVRGMVFEGDSEGINALMELSKNTSPLIQRAVSHSLADCTYSHALRARVIQHEAIVPYMAAMANKKQTDVEAQALCATALKNLSDDPTLAQIKPAGGTAGGVVASVLRLLPPPTPEAGLGVAPVKKAEERKSASKEDDVDAVQEGTAKGSFVRGHGRALNEYPQTWRGVVAQPVAVVSQDGVDIAIAGAKPDWEKIVELEGVPTPLPSTSPEAGSSADAEGTAEGKDDGGHGSRATTPLPDSLQQQTFQSAKSPRSILPPLDAPGQQESKHPPTSPIRTPAGEEPYTGIGAGKTVRGVSPGLVQRRRNDAGVVQGPDGTYKHGKPKLPRVSSREGGHHRSSSATMPRRGGMAEEPHPDDSLWGATGSSSSRHGAVQASSAKSPIPTRRKRGKRSRRRKK